MSSIAINVPQITDADLVFDEAETRAILKFFWPHLGGRIDTADVGNNLRRFAQTILIVAVDATYALGFVESLVNAVRGPARSAGALVSLGRKLAFGAGRNWFKHASRSDLKHPKVAQSVRLSVARNFLFQMQGHLQGTETGKFKLQTIVLVAHHGDSIAWS